jgi:hypothetical protein
MAYSIPTTASGQVLTSAIWNASVRDNIIFLANPPAVRATHNAAQSIATATATALALSTEDYDLAGFHDTATNNSRLTIPSVALAGLYIVTGSAQWAAAAGGTRICWLRRSDGTNFGMQRWLSGNDNDTHSVTGFMRMSVGDYVELYVQHTQGAALNIASGSQMLAMIRVGVG